MSLKQILDPKFGGAFQDEANLLTRAVDLNLVGSILDPCCGAGTLVKEFRRMDLHITSNSSTREVAADFHKDDLSPETYRWFEKKIGLHAIILAPVFTIIDIMFPMCVLFAQQMVACLVPWNYISEAHAARMSWLIELQEQGRLHIVVGDARSHVAKRRAMWIIVFASPVMKTRLLLTGPEGLSTIQLT